VAVPVAPSLAAPKARLGLHRDLNHLRFHVQVGQIQI